MIGIANSVCVCLSWGEEGVGERRKCFIYRRSDRNLRDSGVLFKEECDNRILWLRLTELVFTFNSQACCRRSSQFARLHHGHLLENASLSKNAARKYFGSFIGIFMGLVSSDVWIVRKLSEPSSYCCA